MSALDKRSMFSWMLREAKPMSMKLPEFYEILRKCIRLGHEGIFADMGYEMDQIPASWVDPDVSCYMREKDRLTGILLVGSGAKSEPVITLFFVEGAATSMKLAKVIFFRTGK